ncbi:hypothetical protein, partial [Gluconobacter oxydans]|uniref:hypothetical protein n=1 Tax=Gluconobacter oxydans TaxID=442 RepID=UPI001E4B27D9
MDMDSGRNKRCGHSLLSNGIGFNTSFPKNEVKQLRLPHILIRQHQLDTPNPTQKTAWLCHRWEHYDLEGSKNP